MERDDIKELPMTFTSLYVASKVTGVSDCALRNACEKTNKKITQRKGEFPRNKIDPSPPKESRGAVESYVISRWDIKEMYP